jgi:hypothetical protein
MWGSVAKPEAAVFYDLEFCMHNPSAPDDIKDSFDYPPLVTDILRGG